MKIHTPSMGKPIHYIILAFALLSCLSCKRHVCPAYFTSFNIEKGAPEKFFNYFEADTAKSPVALKDSIPSSARLLRFEKGENPMNDRMFKSKGRDINGLVNRKKNFFASTFKAGKPKEDRGFMKVVPAEITFSDMDSAEIAELYAISDSLFSADRFKRDQYIYMELYGFEILDSMNARAEREKARLDTLSEENLPRKERRMLRKQRKREYRRLKKAAKRGEIDQSEVDAYREKYFSKPKKEKRKKKGDEDTPADGSDADTGDNQQDDDTSPTPSGGDDTSKKKKKDRKKKKDEPPVDDTGGP